MTVGLALITLMALDACFAGYRAVAGRSGRILNGRWFASTMGMGFGLGFAVGAVLLASVWASGGPSDDLVQTGERLLKSFGVFGLIVGTGFVLRAAPSVDLRAGTSIVVFGPFSLLRPVWIVLSGLGCAWTSEPATQGITALGIALVFGVEQVLERWVGPWRAAQREPR